MSVNQIMLLALIAVTAILLIRGFGHRQDMLRFPFLVATVMAGWFIPQAIGLSNDEFLPRGGFALTMFVAILGLGATVLGERLIPARPRALHREHDKRVLSFASAVLTVIGAAAEFMIIHTHIEVAANGGTTGIGSIYFFLMESYYYGLAIALLLLLENFSWVALSIVAVNLLLVGNIVIFGGRRGPASELALIIASAFWFQRRQLPQRNMVIAGAVVATLFVNAIGQYRSLVETINKYSTEPRLPTISEIMDIDFIGTMTKEVTKGSYEVENAIFDIAASSETANYDFGLSYWNYFVFRYVPAQFVGRDVKDGLTVDLPDNAMDTFQYDPAIGTSHTGFSDSFTAFWLFGALVFGLIAAIMQRWWRDAMAGDFESKLLYCVTISVAIEGVSHGTQWFLIYLPQVFMFTMPFFYWARKRPLFARPQPILEDRSAWRRYRAHVLPDS